MSLYVWNFYFPSSVTLEKETLEEDEEEGEEDDEEKEQNDEEEGDE